MIKTAKDRHNWWTELSPQWKKAFNEAMLGKGPIEEKPSDKEIKELFECPNFRFAGPKAFHANMTFELTDLTGLEKMSQAGMITVTFHQLTSLRPIARLKNISALFLDNNKILDLRGLETMTGLKTLVATANEIDSMKPIKNLKNLEYLQIAYNRLSSFEGLTKANTEKLKQFVGLPNRVAQTEIDRVQNDLRLRVLKP